MAANDKNLPAKSEASGRLPGEAWPLSNLRREIDRLFDDFGFGGFSRPLARFDEPFWRAAAGFGAVPAVDVAEKDREYEVSAELPGMEEKDIDVNYADGVLTIRGEKKEEKEEKKKDFYLSERRFGSFQRSFQVPADVDPEKIEAKFANGVLTVTLPKSAEVKKNEKKIAIQTG